MHNIDFKIIEDICYYDGPIISIGLDHDDNPILQIWCDEVIIDDTKTPEGYVNGYGIYAYVYMRKEDLLPFLNDEKLYADTMLDSHKIILFKYFKEPYDFEEINKKEFVEKYGPVEGCRLGHSLLDARNVIVPYLLQQKLEIELKEKTESSIKSKI